MDVVLTRGDTEAVSKNRSMVRGDYRAIDLTFKQTDGTVWDITGWTIRLTIKDNPALADASAILQKTITTHPFPSLGMAQIPILPANTIAVEPGEYFHDIQVEIPAAGFAEIYTIERGRFAIGWGATGTYGTAGTAGT